MNLLKSLVLFEKVLGIKMNVFTFLVTHVKIKLSHFYVYTIKKKILFTLFYIREYVPYVTLAWIFGVSNKETIRKIVCDVRNYMKYWFTLYHYLN